MKDRVNKYSYYIKVKQTKIVMHVVYGQVDLFAPKLIIVCKFVLTALRDAQGQLYS